MDVMMEQLLHGERSTISMKLLSGFGLAIVMKNQLRVENRLVSRKLGIIS